MCVCGLLLLLRVDPSTPGLSRAGSYMSMASLAPSQVPWRVVLAACCVAGRRGALLSLCSRGLSVARQAARWRRFKGNAGKVRDTGVALSEDCTLSSAETSDDPGVSLMTAATAAAAVGFRVVDVETVRQQPSPACPARRVGAAFDRCVNE